MRRGGAGLGCSASCSADEPKLNGRLATRAARRSNGSEGPIRMSGANHFRDGGGGETACSLPLPLRTRTFVSLGAWRQSPPPLARLGCGGPLRRGPSAGHHAGPAPERRWAWPFPARVRAVSLSTARPGRAGTRLGWAPGEGAGGLGRELGLGASAPRKTAWCVLPAACLRARGRWRSFCRPLSSRDPAHGVLAGSSPFCPLSSGAFPGRLSSPGRQGLLDLVPLPTRF